MRLIDEFLQCTPTTTLFHYTSARGLIAILDGGSIYASSAYHQNDSMEFHYAIGLIVEQLRARLAFEKGPWNTSPSLKIRTHSAVSSMPSISRKK
jgi:hypothetical protein